MRLSMPADVPADPEAAVALQIRLREQVITEDPHPPRFGTVAGSDSAYDDTGRVVAAVVVLDAATLETVDTATGSAWIPHALRCCRWRRVIVSPRPPGAPTICAEPCCARASHADRREAHSGLRPVADLVRW